MNENAQKLYDDLVNGRLEEFDMHNFTGDCGTPLCIAGHCAFRLSGIAEWRPESDHIHATSVFLGISEDDVFKLCLPDDGDSIRFPWKGICDNPYMATQQQAAEALRRACTGD